MASRRLDTHKRLFSDTLAARVRALKINPCAVYRYRDSTECFGPSGKRRTFVSRLARFRNSANQRRANHSHSIRVFSFSLFFYSLLSFHPRRETAKDSFTIGGVAKRSPGGRCPCTLVRGRLAGKREIGMRRKRGFSVHTRTYIQVTLTPRSPLSLSLSLSLFLSVFPLFLFSPSLAIALAFTRSLALARARFLFLFSVYPFQVGGAANQSFLREHDGRRR